VERALRDLLAGAACEDSWAGSRSVRRSMQGNRGGKTKPEIALRSALHRNGFRFKIGSRLIPGTRRTADIAFTTEKVAVFVDGCFWHGCAMHGHIPLRNESFWSAKIIRNKQRDAEVDQSLIEAGWAVIRVWEHESIDDALRVVATRIRERRGVASSRPARGAPDS
jgi:DNA mismatch endonuclease, patch repair protein